MLVYYFVSANIIMQVIKLVVNVFFLIGQYFLPFFFSFFHTYFLSFRIVITVLFSFSVLLAFTATLLIRVLNKGDVMYIIIMDKSKFCNLSLS